MKEIIFATHNKHKLDEVIAIVQDRIKIIGLQELNFNEDIEETADTLEGNALLKAKTIFNRFDNSCFADDTGLEIEALDGRPGVYSARYASNHSDSKANMVKVLLEMQGKKNRKAQFRTVITLIKENGEIEYFEGVVKGIISEQPKGNNGFGYDPIFIPEGYDKSFAELSAEEKNRISHRSRAISKLTDYLFAEE